MRCAHSCQSSQISPNNLSLYSWRITYPRCKTPAFKTPVYRICFPPRTSRCQTGKSPVSTDTSILWSIQMSLCRIRQTSAERHSHPWKICWLLTWTSLALPIRAGHGPSLPQCIPNLKVDYFVDILKMQFFMDNLHLPCLVLVCKGSSLKLLNANLVIVEVFPTFELPTIIIL